MEYRISGPGSQGLWTVHGTDGQPVKFRGAFLQFNDAVFAQDFTHMLNMARLHREDMAKREVWEKVMKEAK